jgi:outer membrane protein assembly factor BamA
MIVKVWKSPMGPIRFDVGSDPVEQAYDKIGPFRFSTSTRF